MDTTRAKTMAFKCPSTPIILIFLYLSARLTDGSVLALQGEEDSMAAGPLGSGRMGGGSGTTVKRALGTESPDEMGPQDDGELLMGPLPVPADGGAAAGGVQEGDSISELLPKEGTLFSKDAVDPSMLEDIDCHMRNLDLCYAGMLSASAKMLPETDGDLEMRCDEMKAVTSCIAVYNQRCQAFKLMATFMPMAGISQSKSMMPKELQEMELPMELLTEGGQQLDPKRPRPTPIRAIDFMELCEPSAKGGRANRELRQRLFQLAKCINPRMNSMRPCFEDLKGALQLFYEPGRFLPLEPTCCAVSRFRHCSRKALDGICGLSSFDQLESTFASGPGRQLTGILQRSCRKRAGNFDTAYCQEVLPASGVKAPQRRGRKASKLAKALDLLSFAPAT